MENQQLLEEKLRLEGQLKSGAGWFYWIAGLSIINSLIIIFGGEWSFIVGLGITQFVDAFGKIFSGEFGTNLFNYIAIGIDIIIAGIFVLFGYFSKKRYKASFIIGMILYALDGLIFVFVRDFLSAAFHAYALYGIYKGMQAINRLNVVEKNLIELSNSEMVNDLEVEPIELQDTISK